MRLKKGPIRVMVVEDSPTARNMLVALFNRTSDIQVVGTALDGEEAVLRASELLPDVITMDIHMPRLNGLEATRRIMQKHAIPIVMVTSSVNRPDMDLTFEAIRAGALTVVKKPGLDDEAMCEQMVQTVRLMADVQVVRRWNTHVSQGASPASPTAAGATNPAMAAASPTAAAVPPGPVSQTTIALASALPSRSNGVSLALMRDFQKYPRTVVGVASSTGGPNALVNMLRPLSANFPLPILVVQHITRGFGISLAEWLNTELKLKVRLAQQNELPEPGTVLIAPDDRHMQISDRGTVLLHNSPPYKGLRPSANYLFFSMARVYNRRAIGIILTGMGDDGVEGLIDLHQQGGLVLAQDEASSVVYGMPREAAMRNAVDHIMPVDQMGQALLQCVELRGVG